MSVCDYLGLEALQLTGSQAAALVFFVRSGYTSCGPATLFRRATGPFCWAALPMDTSNVETNRRGFSPLTFAFLCGGLPLVLGCGIFFLWCATDWGWLQNTGILNIYFGVIALLIGICCLAAHFVSAIRERPIDWRRIAWGSLASVVLAANFPVCGVIMDTVFRLQDAQRVADLLRQRTMQSMIRVVNAGEAPIESVVVNGVPYGGELGTIPPGGGTSFFFHPMKDQPLTITLWNTHTDEQTVTVPSAGEHPVDIVAVAGVGGDFRIVTIQPRQISQSVNDD